MARIMTLASPTEPLVAAERGTYGRPNRGCADRRGASPSHHPTSCVASYGALDS